MRKIFLVFCMVFVLTSMYVYSQERSLTFYMTYDSGELNPAEGAWSTPEGEPHTDEDYRTREATGFLEGNETEYGIQYSQNFINAPYLTLGLNLKILTEQNFLYEAQNNTNRAHIPIINGSGSADYVFKKKWVGLESALKLKEIRAGVILTFNVEQLGFDNYLTDGLYAFISLDNRMLASANVGYSFDLNSLGINGGSFNSLVAYEFWALPKTAEINERGTLDPFYKYSHLVTDVLSISLNYTSPWLFNYFQFSSTVAARFNGPSLGVGGTVYSRDSKGELSVTTDTELVKYATYKYVGFLDNFEFRWENYISANFDDVTLSVGVRYNLRNIFYKGFDKTIIQGGSADNTLFSPELDLVHQVELRAGIYYALDLSFIGSNSKASQGEDD